MHRSPTRRRRVLVAACLLVLTGCGVDAEPTSPAGPIGSGRDGSATTGAGPAPASPSTGFVLGRVPAGYQPLAAGRGEAAAAAPLAAATAVVARPFDVGGGPRTAPDGVHVAIWSGPEGARLVVASLPPGIVELAEVPSLMELGPGDRGDVIPAGDTGGGRDVATIELAPPSARRVVATTDGDGELFVVQALPGEGDLMAESELVAVVLSIGAVGDDAWEASASGDVAGTEPAPSEGAREITRSGGDAGDPAGWLLETTDAVPGTELGRQASPCLRLTHGRAACAEVRFAGPDHVVSVATPAALATAGAPDHRPFVVVTARGPARSVLLTVGPTTTGADLLPVPGTDDLVAAVVLLGDVPSFADLATAEFSCDPARTTASTTTAFSYEGVPRLDLLDADEQPVGCLGP